VHKKFEEVKEEGEWALLEGVSGRLWGAVSTIIYKINIIFLIIVIIYTISFLQIYNNNISKTKY